MNYAMKQRFLCLASFCIAMMAACSKPQTQTEGAVLNQMPAGKEFSGFLSSYANLKPNPDLENILSYVKGGDAKNIHQYLAVIIDPVQLYVSSNTDVYKMPDRGRTALAEYFQHAIRGAVSDAFAPVAEPGPLVLRLRAALVGVDIGGEIPGGGKDNDPLLERAVNLGKVGVEMEMVDSVSGEQILAAVDRQNLGDGAEIRSANFSREAKFEAARDAIDGWAARLRAFLDSANELSKDDAVRADADYRPYGEAEAVRK
jgi:hypothetical protein